MSPALKVICCFYYLSHPHLDPGAAKLFLSLNRALDMGISLLGSMV